MKKLLVALAFASCALLSAADSSNTLQQQKAAAEALIQEGNNDLAIGTMESADKDIYLGGALAVDNSSTRAEGERRKKAGQTKVDQGTRELADITQKIKAAADSLRERLAKANFRLWHDKNGRAIRAELEEVQGNNIHILRDDGAEFTLSEDTLSPEDVAWIKDYQNGVLAKAGTAPATVAANTTINTDIAGDTVTAQVNVAPNPTVIAASDTIGDLDKAIADNTRGIELDPENYAAYNSRGIAKRAKGDLDGAIADFTSAIGLNSKDTAPYINRGITKFNKGDLDGAISELNHALEQTPNDVGAYDKACAACNQSFEDEDEESDAHERALESRGILERAKARDRFVP